jgi:hypothetical protein
MELETGYLCPFSSTCMNMWSLYGWGIGTGELYMYHIQLHIFY